MGAVTESRSSFVMSRAEEWHRVHIGKKLANASQKPISVDKVIFVSLEKLFHLRENCREETALGCVIKTIFNQRASWIHKY